MDYAKNQRFKKRNRLKVGYKRKRPQVKQVNAGVEFWRIKQTFLET